MTDYRIYSRTSLAGFDGTTPETSTYSQTGYLWVTPSTSTVGSFSKTALGRQRGTASLVNVFSDGALVPGETVQVITPTGSVRQTEVFGPNGTGWMLLMPDDVVTITAPAIVFQRTAEIFVNDLSDEQLAEYIANTACCGGNVPAVKVAVLTLNAPQQLPPLDGEMIVFLNLAVAGDITLQNLADITDGSKITFIRIGGLLPTIVPVVGDSINGSANPLFTPYPMRSVNDSVQYYKVPGGFARKLGFQAGPVVVGAVSPVAIPASSEGIQNVVLAIGAPGGLANLPAISDCREGFQIAFLNAGLEAVTIVPDGTDTINNSVRTYILQAGSSAFFEVSLSVGAGVSWIAVEQDESPLPLTGLLPGPLVIPAFRGAGRLQVQTLTDVVLPAPGTLQFGASILILSKIPQIVTITSAGGAGINDLPGRQIIKGRSALFVNTGTSWIAVDGNFYDAPATSAFDPAVISPWTDSPFHFESTAAILGHVILLPSAADVSPGSLVIIFNNSAFAGTVTAQPGETINTAGAFSIAANTTMAVWQKSSTEWIAVRSA